MTTLEKFKAFAPVKNELGQNNNAIIYTRVSSKEQADTNTSLETQKNIVRTTLKLMVFAW